MVEGQQRDTQATVADMEPRLQLVLNGLTVAAEATLQANTTALQNTTACQELRVTAATLLKSQECMVRVVNNLESRMDGLGARLTTLEQLSPGAHSYPPGIGAQGETRGTPKVIPSTGLPNSLPKFPAPLLQVSNAMDHVVRNDGASGSRQERSRREDYHHV